MLVVSVVEVGQGRVTARLPVVVVATAEITKTVVGAVEAGPVVVGRVRLQVIVLVGVQVVRETEFAVQGRG